jgi:NAD(P)-dependent dehydrogenase (short-subunit alcohol dehydrogenase family)
VSGHARPRVVVVTGASAGIGRASALAFAERGDRVALLARGTTGLDAAAREVRECGGTALPISVDVSDHEALERAADRVEDELGPIDVWVNNAFTSVFAPFMEIEPEEFRRVTEVTYVGVVYGTKAALRRMLPRDRGAIVQVGSALAYRAIPLQSPYCAAKFAIRGFTDSLRSELAHKGSAVHLTMVQLPAVNTPQFDWSRNRMPRRAQPVPPIFQPEVAAEAILFAAQARRREVWVGSSTVKAILANRLVPGMLDRYLGQAGYDGQMSDEPAPADADGNLFEPMPGDHGAHGRFDREASPRSPALWATMHRGGLLTGLAVGVAIAAMLFPARAAARTRLPQRGGA